MTQTVRIKVKPKTKFKIEPKGVGIILQDKRKHPTDFQLHLTDGTTIRRSQIMNPVYKRINEQAQKKQLSQEELSAVLNALSEKGYLGEEFQRMAKETPQEPEHTTQGHILTESMEDKKIEWFLRRYGVKDKEEENEENKTAWKPSIKPYLQTPPTKLETRKQEQRLLKGEIARKKMQHEQNLSLLNEMLQTTKAQRKKSERQLEKAEAEIEFSRQKAEQDREAHKRKIDNLRRENRMLHEIDMKRKGIKVTVEGEEK